VPRNLGDFEAGRNRICEECLQPLNDGQSHIHLGQEDVDSIKSIRDASMQQADMEEHMRTAPVDLNDHAALLAHLQSSGHYEDTHSNEMDIDELRQIHEDDHKMQEEEYGEDADSHITVDSSHFHH